MRGLSPGEVAQLRAFVREGELGYDGGGRQPENGPNTLSLIARGCVRVSRFRIDEHDAWERDEVFVTPLGRLALAAHAALDVSLAS